MQKSKSEHERKIQYETEIQKGRQQKEKARDRRRMRHEGKSSSKSVNERQRRRKGDTERARKSRTKKEGRGKRFRGGEMQEWYPDTIFAVHDKKISQEHRAFAAPICYGNKHRKGGSGWGGGGAWGGREGGYGYLFLCTFQSHPKRSFPSLISSCVNIYSTCSKVNKFRSQ